MSYLKYLLGISVWMTCIITIAQQRPVINSLSKTSGAVGETITITGSGFPANTGDVQVNFGAGVAIVTSAAANQLVVTVPNTATVAPVTVLDLTTGLKGSSSHKFTLSYGGSDFLTSGLDTQVDNNTDRNQTYDICTCDFDGDGNVDAALSNLDDVQVSVFRNTSTLATTSFSRTNIANGQNTVNTDCGDLNGDGLPDLVFSNNNATATEDVFVFRNTSTPGSISIDTKDFADKIPNLDNGNNRNARKILIADVDGDGMNDLVIGNDSDNSIFIYLNTTGTIGGTISFNATPEQVIVEGPSSTGSLAVGDMNGDGLVDLVTTAFDPFGQGNSDIYILKNISSVGSVNFESAIGTGVSVSGVETFVADFDGDNMLDIVTTDRLDNDLFVIPNTTSGGNLSFGAAVILTSTTPWGIAPADYNGDGLTDIATASVSGQIEVFLNTSSGSLSFDPAVSISTTNNVRNIDAVDFNGDAKPDFGFSHNSITNSPGQFSIVINRNCFSPSITPTDLTFCPSSPFTVYATKTVEATYNWLVASGDASISGSGDNVDVTVSSGTSVTLEVTIQSNDGSCAGAGENTTQQVFTITGTTPPATPSVTNSNTGTICSGTDFTLTGTGGHTTYFWTLPDGTELEQTTNTLTISGASSSDAGEYGLRVQDAGGCVSDEGTITVAVDENPPISIGNLGTDDFCANSSTTLQVAQYAGFTYQWQDGSGDITGATTNSYTASATGDYLITITSGTSGCSSTTAPYTVTAVPLPTSAFTSASEICVNTDLSLSATSTGQSGFALDYTWDFGDGSATETGMDVTHAYTTAGDYTVTLTTGYAAVDACTAAETLTVTASDPAPVNIIVPGGSIEKCPNDSIRLELPQNYQSYSWSTGDTVYFTYAKTRTNVDTAMISVTMVTDIGCSVPSDTVVSNFANSRITISSTDADIVNDTITLADGVATVTLTAQNGSTYTWTPATILDNTSTGTVTARPQSEFTTITVNGTDALNGCETTATVVIRTPGIIARKSFSPNGDGLGYDCWEILNTNALEGCTVYIMDERGRYVFQGDSPFESNCVWNGNLDNGSSPAPEGIYYFILKCENSDNNQSGSILLAR